jgi:hypothetical protein
VEATPGEVSDVSALAILPDHIDGSAGLVTTDGAYDGQAPNDAVLQRQPAAGVIILPRSTAVATETWATRGR